MWLALVLIAAPTRAPPSRNGVRTVLLEVPNEGRGTSKAAYLSTASFRRCSASRRTTRILKTFVGGAARRLYLRWCAESR